MTESPTLRPGYFQVLCGLALVAIFLTLAEQGALIVGLAVILLGAPAVLVRVRVSPVFVVLLLVGGLLFQQAGPGLRRAPALLDGDDLLLCAATLAFVAGQYRLLSLASHILPPDARQRPSADRPAQPTGRIVLQPRPATALAPTELVWFLLQLPMFALAAQAGWLALGTRFELHQLPLRWVQLLQLVWGLALVLFLAGLFFRYRRWRTMAPLTARVLLQDVLWHETRGEQRRIARWLAWWRLRAKSRRP